MYFNFFIVADICLKLMNFFFLNNFRHMSATMKKLKYIEHRLNWVI